MLVMQCHLCPHQSHPTPEACWNCKPHSDQDLRHRIPIDDDDSIPQPDTSGSDYATHLDPDDEDRLRIAMANLFSLSPIELLYIQNEMMGRTLTEFGSTVDKFVRQNANGCSTARAYEIRKRVGEKLPMLKPVLLTRGRRR